MTPEKRLQAALAADLHLPVFLYDGDCGFCRRWAEWLVDRTDDSLPIVPFQAVDHDALGLAEGDLRSASYLVDAEGEAHWGSNAFAAAFEVGPQPWSAVGRMLRLPVVRTVAAIAYRAVARNRHRLPAPG